MSISIVGFVGSLRKGSYNRSLMEATKELLPEGVSLSVADIGSLPLYSEDLDGNPPQAAKELKRQVKAADAILIVTPEYNYSIPGGLKNALDWASRPYGDNSFEDKPVAVMGASVGPLGGARAQYHLRQVFTFLNMQPINRPEVFVSFADQHFDNEGRLKTQMFRDQIRQLLEALVAWTRRLRP